MSSNDGAGKISESMFIAASTTLFALALIGAAARIAIRLYYQRRLYIDDAFLLFAIICLCAAMGLLYLFTNSSSMYLVEALITNDPNIDLPGDFFAQSIRFQKLSDAFLVLTYTAIFGVKFSFLYFFRILISRVRKMVTYWRVVAGATGMAWVFGVVGIFATCPYFDIRSVQCGQADQFPMALAISATMITLDITTDVLIIVIPIRMLWNMRIRFRQKLAIGTTLCLSIAMILTCILQISNIRTSSSSATIDVSWEIFWQGAEACIAVLMVSLTALRSLFVGQWSRPRPSPGQSWTSEQAKRWLKRVLPKRSQEIWTSDREQRLPSIPRATLTGLRTFIRGDRESTVRSMVQTERAQSSGEDNVRHGAEAFSATPETTDLWALPPLIPPQRTLIPQQDVEMFAIYRATNDTGL